MKLYTLRRGFTFIEILFVIVVLGIVGGVALEAIRNYYEGIYKSQEHTNKAQDADAILDLVVKYFENGVSVTVANIDGGVCSGAPQPNDAADHTIGLIAVDVDSLRQGALPGWSEEVEVLPGNVVRALDANYLSINNLANLAVFNRDSVEFDTCNRFWGAPLAGYHTIANPTNTTLTLNTTPVDGHQKYILRTGYAFEVQDNGDFILYSGFSPWAGGTHLNGQQSLLGENVAHFYASYDLTGMNGASDVNDRGMIWRLKVCMKGLDESLSTENSTEAQSICRERSVHVRY